MDELIKVLQKTVSPSQEDQNEAIRYIENYLKSNLNDFLKLLSDVLYNQANPPVVRAAAGLQLKNQLTARDELIKQKQQENWRNLPAETRQYIKERVFSALGTEIFRPSSAPQCVAYIAIVELPDKQWPGLIEALVRNVTDKQSSDPIRLATLEAIGYICQDIDQSWLDPNESNCILTAIVSGMQVANKDVKLAATTALLNSLEFTEANFQNERERNYIMEVVCQTTQCEDVPVRVAALQCLVKIMSLYYQFMEHYMAVALFAITMQAMKSENDDVALQGIEFWSNVCDEEIQLASDALEAQELNIEPERRSKHFARTALQHLVPILVEMLARQDENDDTEEWKPCKSAGVCLMLLANCCENAIVAYVLPYIKQNILSEDWKRRDAAIMTFGSILDGPDQATLKPIAEQIVPYLINFMKDPSVVVRDSAAWAIGKLCDTVPEAVLTQNYLTVLVQALIANLGSEPRVAANVCWAINSLVSAAGEIARETCSPNDVPTTFVLSQFYMHIIEQLLKTNERQDNSRDQEHNLRNASYEALMAVIKAAPQDQYSLVYPSTYQVIINRIQVVTNLLRQENSSPDVRAQLHDLQSLLWTTMQSMIRRMTKKDINAVSDEIMQNLLLTLRASPDSNAVIEDALMAASILLEAVGKLFSRYIEAFKPDLIMSISNPAAPQLNNTAMGLLSDLSRNIEMDLLPYCDEFMNLLYSKLADDQYDKLAKAQILSIFGDFALAFGTSFERWVPRCLEMLHQAASINAFDRNDYDMVEYCTKLREYALEGYTGIIQGSKGTESKPSLQSKCMLLTHMNSIVQFLVALAVDPDLTDTLLFSSCGLIGDIAENLGKETLSLLNRSEIYELLNKGKKSKTGKTSTVANWALEQVESLKEQNSLTG